MTIEPRLKDQVKNFWRRSACGEIYGVGVSKQEIYDIQSLTRYRLEQYLAEFARFYEGFGKDVLEIGVGMGADHVEWARSRQRSLTSIDLTARAVDHVKQRFDTYGLKSNVFLGDAENLPFLSKSFDIVCYRT